MYPLPRLAAVVAIGGMVGGSMRYALGLVFPGDATAFPWTTFAINVVGTFALAALMTVLDQSVRERAYLRALLTTGLLSSLTTFSTFTLATVALTASNGSSLAGTYLVANVVSGLAATVLGIRAARGTMGRA